MLPPELSKLQFDVSLLVVLIVAQFINARFLNDNCAVCSVWATVAARGLLARGRTAVSLKMQLGSVRRE